jgi:hypothetical protein
MGFTSLAQYCEIVMLLLNVISLSHVAVHDRSYAATSISRLGLHVSACCISTNCLPFMFDSARVLRRKASFSSKCALVEAIHVLIVSEDIVVPKITCSGLDSRFRYTAIYRTCPLFPL